MIVLDVGFICVSEVLGGLVFYSYLIVFFSVCFFFFFSGSFLIFYIFYELTMLPVLFCLLVCGRQVKKVRACYYLVFYTLFFVNFFVSLCFLIKFPVYFLHVWLPKVHVEAPTNTRMVLAGVMLKLSGAGLYHFIIDFFSLIGMVFCSFICIFQSDLAAYSSICHMGFVLLSEISMLYYVMILSHGYTSVLIFYFIGEFYHIARSRLVYYLRGIFFLFVYYLVSFYYSIYIMVCFMVGNKVSYVCDSRAIVCLPLFIICFGLFLLFNMNIFCGMTFGNVLKQRIINTVNHKTIGTYYIVLVYNSVLTMREVLIIFFYGYTILIGGFGN
ncbi:unnamed protein product [Brugia timori]|uniref:NADH-ubiquinone oxidoreductase chain 4 n=1 Tax=Brugia timori TaxID=42155 RepID=A0A3P7X1Q7_9BILA|nr:unnamed protein product [Brugia timori]